MAKKEQVKEIFNDIAPKYDKLNHLLSMNIDKGWRKKAVANIDVSTPKRVLDIACGTGDFSIAAYKRGVRDIVGLDISQGMVEIGQKKIASLGLEDSISLQTGDSENIHFEDESFDAVIVAFGVRNFENLEKGLCEMHRVLKTGGKVIILEFSMPRTFPIKQLYKFYFKRMLPWVGGLISGNKSAYEYLPDSVEKFPHGEVFLKILRSCGFNNATQKRLSAGVASIYIGYKDKPQEN